MRWRIPWSSLWRIGLASATMAIVTWAAFAWSAPSLLTLALQAVLGIAVYSLLLIGLKAVRPDELAFLRAISARGLARLRRGTRPAV
jgi:hypothetical protein